MVSHPENFSLVSSIKPTLWLERVIETETGKDVTKKQKIAGCSKLMPMANVKTFKDIQKCIAPGTGNRGIEVVLEDGTRVIFGNHRFSQLRRMQYYPSTPEEKKMITDQTSQNFHKFHILNNMKLRKETDWLLLNPTMTPYVLEIKELIRYVCVLVTRSYHKLLINDLFEMNTKKYKHLSDVIASHLYNRIQSCKKILSDMEDTEFDESKLSGRDRYTLKYENYFNIDLLHVTEITAYHHLLGYSVPRIYSYLQKLKPKNPQRR